MPTHRICKSFVVESGHMLSKHPESCRFPHGHTRRIEVVCSRPTLDENDMVVDFKALKLALKCFINQLDHRMALNSSDPLREDIERVYPDSVVVFEDQDPTTEVLAKWIFEFVAQVLAKGFETGAYRIPAGQVTLERIRVWETETSWAEYGP